MRLEYRNNIENMINEEPMKEHQEDERDELRKWEAYIGIEMREST